MTYREIPQLISGGSYEVNMAVYFLKEKIAEWQADPYYQLQLCPDFQRGRVWTPEQQTAFIEYFLKGGRSGMVLYFNKPSWQSSHGVGEYDDFVLVDGLQRLTALLEFMDDKVPAFGQVCSEFGPLRFMRSVDALRFNVNNLKTKAEVLQWYLQMNAGGTPHTKEEIARVESILSKEIQKHSIP